MADLDKSIDNLRNQVGAAVRGAGPDWTGLCELIEGGLDDATDEELRPLFLEFFESIASRGTRSPWIQVSRRLAAMLRMAVAIHHDTSKRRANPR